MEHANGSLYWPGTSPNYYMYPKLERSIRTQALVIGAGWSGTLCGSLLAKSGRQVTVVDRGGVAGGAAPAHSGIVQYAGSVMLCDLIDRIGERSAVRLYAACRHAVEHLSMIADSLSRDTGFKRRSSLYYADDEHDLTRLEREFRAQRTYGFDIEYWSPSDLAAHFPFHASGAIVTHGDAELNPYLFVHEAAASGIRAGMDLYEDTEVVKLDRCGALFRAVTSEGLTIEAEHVIYAAGNEPEAVRAKRVHTALKRAYTIVTEPQTGLAEWHRRFLIGDAAPASFHMRTTPDGRILAGGLAETASFPTADRHVRYNRSMQLQHVVHRHFPQQHTAIAHDWCTAFDESRDGLPFIGEDPDTPGIFYNIGSAGNSLVYGMLAAQIIRDSLLGGDPHAAADLLRLNRPAYAAVLR